MDWDYSFFIPKNNAFSKKWSASEDDEASLLIVTEVNRCQPCVSCLKAVGEKGTTFYEIEGKVYCNECGTKVLDLRNGKKNSGNNLEIAPGTS